MAARENVTAASLKVCTLKGKDIKDLVRTITIRESICSPFITAEILLLDNDNVIPNMKLQGGDRCDVEFDAINAGPYVIDLYLLHINPEVSRESLQLKIYTLSLMTIEYFTDQGTRTPKTTEIQQTGVSMVRRIWTDAGFKTPLSQPAQDAPLQDGDQSLTIGLMKPLTAIGQVRDIQVYPTYPTGNVLLFRNATSVVHAPLQYIYETCSAGLSRTLLQKYTWGYKIEHMFLGSEAERAIISLLDNSRAVMLDPNEFKPGELGRSADDLPKGKLGARTAFAAVAGGIKGAAHALTNSNKTSTPIDHTQIMINARCYAHCLKAQTQYLAQIPLQSGINITVGTGVILALAPSVGGSTLISPNSGLYLVTDLVHTVNHDLREVNGTTTLQCLQTGADCGV